MKKRTIDNYALQFGKKAIPKHLFEVPSELYVKAYSRCVYMSEGRRVQHYYQEGEPCHRCSMCRKENREHPCTVCNQRMRNQPRFMERVSVTRKGNGLLSANYYEEGEVYCTSCAQKMCQTHPHGNVITDPKLIHQVCKLNQMDFPPYWAVGRWLLRDHVYFDKEGNDGKNNNLWNPILDPPSYDELPDPKVADEGVKIDTVIHWENDVDRM